VEHLSPLDPGYTMAHDKIGSYLGSQGLPPGGADGLLYRELVRQSTTLAFTDAFLVICLLILCVLPLVFIMQRAAPASSGKPTVDVH
jgi:DHA2 family multidrug resistance protein